jgi:hypothetical protein
VFWLGNIIVAASTGSASGAFAGSRVVHTDGTPGPFLERGRDKARDGHRWRFVEAQASAPAEAGKALADRKSPEFLVRSSVRFRMMG